MSDRCGSAAGLGQQDFLAVATPGAGKTTFALTAACQHLIANPGRRLVVVAPTAHLKTQWATAAERFSLHLEPAWQAADGRLPPDLHGIVTTYQQVATSAGALAIAAKDAFVILDEVHHASDDRAWGDSVRAAFDGAGFRLSLSGTPFRSDTSAIPFVRYELEEAVPDYEYGYGDALTDGRVVRPCWFPRLGGEMEWSDAGGNAQSATFDDELDQARAAQRLRTALSIEGEWLPAVLRAAHAKLLDLRRTAPDAGGLVIAADQDHARGIARLLRDRFHVRATVVLSDDPMSSARIAQFAASEQPWIVAVRMVSEGVDIPRLRVGVFATTTTTELFFRQAVGRLVRWTTPGRAQKAFMFIPDDPRLRSRAFQIAEQRRHSLRKREQADKELSVEDIQNEEAKTAPDGDQLSMFAALAATPVEGEGWEHRHADVGMEDGAEWHDADEHTIGGDDPSLVIEVPTPPTPGGRAGPGSAADVSDAGPTPRERKEALRIANKDAAEALVQKTGMSHARVNKELNHNAGIAKITEATFEQMEKRLRIAERILGRRLRPDAPVDPAAGGAVSPPA